MENTYHANTNIKKARVFILISDQISFRTKKILMIKRNIT